MNNDVLIEKLCFKLQFLYIIILALDVQIAKRTERILTQLPKPTNGERKRVSLLKRGRI